MRDCKKSVGKFLISLAVLFCTAALQATDLYSLIPSPAEAVILFNTGKIREQLTAPEGKELSMFLNMKDFLVPGGNMDTYFSEVVVAVHSLRKKRYTAFCRTVLPEKDFSAVLKKCIPGVKVTSRKVGSAVIYQLSGSDSEFECVFAAYAAKDVLLFSEMDPAWYFTGKTARGLSKDNRALLDRNCLVSGFASPEKKFYRKNPFFPRFARVSFCISAAKDSSLTFLLKGPLAAGEDPALKLQQIQQTRMMLALLLSNIDPDLPDEFMKNGSVSEKNNILTVRQHVPGSMLKKIVLQGIPLMTGPDSGLRKQPVSNRKAVSQ